MIDLEITESPDKSLLGRHVYYLNELNIGQDKCDLCLYDGLTSPHFFLKVKEGELILGLYSSDHFIHINGKKTFSQAKIFACDLIQINQTSIKVNAFKESYVPEKEDVLNFNLDYIQSNMPEYLKMLNSFKEAPEA